MLWKPPETRRDCDKWSWKRRASPFQHLHHLPFPSCGNSIPTATMSSRERSPTPSSEGSALPWILDHIMKYPGSYEIPLRRMYELNSMPNPQLPTAHQSPQTPVGIDRNPTRNAFNSPAPAKRPHAKEEQNAADLSDAAATFKANLMSEIAARSCQPCSSLPPSFITSFVRGSLSADLDQVQFEQAMTALDYLKDLERSRKKNYCDALTKLGVSEHDDENGDLSMRYPGVARWLGSIKKKNRFALALYTQVYLRIRYWVRITRRSTDLSFRCWHFLILFFCSCLLLFRPLSTRF